MFNEGKIEVPKSIEDGADFPKIDRGGFERYEDTYHCREHGEVENTIEKDDKRIIEICETALNKINEIAGVIDTYIEKKISGCINLDHADVDKIFDEDEFVSIIKQYNDGSIIPAICYWNTLKQAFTEYRDFNANYAGNNVVNDKHIRHEKRVRLVSELLINTVPFGTLARLGYQFITGKEPEMLKKLDSTISEKIVDASDAALYLTASAGVGCLRVIENAIKYAGAAIESLANNKENAEKILTLDISGDLKNKLDEVYGRDNWARAISGCIEKFGTTATYMGLTMLLPAGGVKAVAGGIGLVVGKAGEKTTQDFKKTGELTAKELGHGAISGAIMLGCAELGYAAADKLGSSAPKIASEINKMLGGNVDPKLLKSITSSVVNGLDAGLMFTAYDVPEQVSKEVERALDIDPEAKANWMETLGGAGAAILTAATFTFIKELYVNRGFYSTYEERINRTPMEKGTWAGKRGESKFISDSDEVTSYLKDAKINGINYKNGIPDFTDVSKGEVKIQSMSSERHTTMGRIGNFEQADAALAQKRGNGCTARDVANWRKIHGYTWHELNDMETCQKVPTVINKVFRHLGGVSECKHREAMMNEIIGKYTNKGGVFDE